MADDSTSTEEEQKAHMPSDEGPDGSLADEDELPDHEAGL